MVTIFVNFYILSLIVSTGDYNIYIPSSLTKCFAKRLVAKIFFEKKIKDFTDLKYIKK